MRGVQAGQGRPGAEPGRESPAVDNAVRGTHAIRGTDTVCGSDAIRGTDAGWLTAAVDLACRNVTDGGGPFGAFIVRDGVELGRGVNRVTRDNDPTAHAEICAIRAACARLGDFSLAGATLYASCEPCPLCLSASLWARVDRVLFAADRYDAARAGFDDLKFYRLFAKDRALWPTTVAKVAVVEAIAPFDTWLSTPDRLRY
jgi:guanine deaminase